jgi:hypothetical protein
MESFLNVLIAKNVLIIEVLIGTILFMACFAGYRWFTAKPSVEGGAPLGGGGPDLKELEETLKKVLEKAGTLQPMAMPTGEMSEADSAALAASQDQIRRLTVEIGNLKSDLGNKQKQMEEMSKAAASGGGGGGEPMASGEKSVLESQIKELQSKLSEYEIISEDIADLSFYKEQTAKLQREVDALKANPAVASAAPVAPPKAEPVIAGSAKATQAANATSVPQIGDDVLSDFAAAVEDQRAAKAAAPPEATPAKAAPVVDPAGEVDLGSLDMDKMLNEAAGIGTEDVPEISAEQALGTGLDESKLLSEAAGMNSPVSEEDKNLMGQFENFVKSNEKV